MPIRVSLPLDRTDSAKDMVFTILSKEYPLKIIDLTNIIKKRYGKSITFQAVRKALLELSFAGVINQTGKEFSISREYVRELKQKVDTLYTEIYEQKSKPTREDAIGNEIAVFTFKSLNDMMVFWQDLIDDWYKHLKKGDPNVNVYQAAHAWEVLLHPDRERQIMGKLKKKGIKSYILSIGSTALDRNIKRFYHHIGVKMEIDPSLSSFDRKYYVGTYGDLIVQTQYPPDIVQALEVFFRKNSTLEKLDITELSRIVNKKSVIKLTVIKNMGMAKQINASVLGQMD